MDVIPFETDVLSEENWLEANSGYSTIHTQEGQFMLEMIRQAIRDYQLVSKKGVKKPLEAGEYHSTQKAGHYIGNIEWWLFEENENSKTRSVLPFYIVCEFLGFHPDFVRRSIKSRTVKFDIQQSHRKRNTIKKQVIAIRARDDLISEEGGNSHACRTVTGKT